MAVPKRKSSKARKNKRRSNVWKISAPAFSKCPNCGALTVPHRVFARHVQMPEVRRDEAGSQNVQGLRLLQRP